MIEPFLKTQLAPVVARYRRLRLRRALALNWSAFALLGILLGLLFWRLGQPVSPNSTVLGLALAALIAGLVIRRRNRAWEPDYRQVARRIEAENPELHALLLTAVEQQPDPASGQLHFLQQRVIEQAAAESQRQNWVKTVSGVRLRSMAALQLGAFLLLIGVLVALQQTYPAWEKAGTVANHVTVQPGDASIERGDGFSILARFEGEVPPEVTLVIGPTSADLQRIPLSRSMEDPLFGTSIPEVTTDLVYRLEFGGQQTREYRITVFEFPRLERADARVKYPDYTGLNQKEIQDTRRVSAVEGSLLDLDLQFNKPVASARLIGRDKSEVPLLLATNGQARLQDLPLHASQAYELQLVDHDGRTNKLPAQFVFQVLKNRAPELKFIAPRGDQRVSALQEINFQAELSDDFALRAYGLTYTLAGQEPREIAWQESSGANESRQMQHLLKLEELAAQPDQLLSYYLWAEDIGPDGQVRRTSSDMYFAEVRPFEEIFREGQSPEGEPSQQQQQNNPATKLADLQKQIINATWKLQRQAALTRDGVSSQYRKDAPVIQESQQEALNQVQEQKNRNPDPRAQLNWQAVEQEMQKALGHLEAAQSDSAPLAPALSAEQAAYQALLKLAAREFQVSRSRQRQSGGGGGQERQQQQLDNLDLQKPEDRYETQRRASVEQTRQQREQLQILNRLKELAQRQQDVNERLKELQTALQEAKTEAEKEEIRRRLKRLREEEQQMLADLDELQQRMERAENQAQMAEARQQLEQTRNEIQRATEAMEKEAVPQALTAGTRAERELQQMREEFRKKSSSQFSEQMEQMRQDARQLAQKEEQIGRQMEQLGQQQRKSLSDSGNRQELASQLEEQRQRMTNLLDQVAQVSEQSENAEPLLSKQLYDTLRKSSQANTDNALEMSSELLKRNFLTDASRFEQRARAQINDLKQGVERAAEGVLGDETEALRLARKELDELTRQLEEEIAQANPQRGSTNQSASARSRDSDEQGKAPGQQAKASSSSKGEAKNSSPSAKGETKNPSASKGEGKDSQAKGKSSGDGKNEGKNSEATAQKKGESPGRPGESSTNPSGQPGEMADNTSEANGPPGEGQRGGEQRAQNTPRQRSSLSGERNSGEPSGGAERGGTWANRGGERDWGNPLTGGGYEDWSERLRDVQEMLDTPELRNQAAQVRERARELRLELKRHSKEPQWDLVQAQIFTPLAQLRDRVSEELARRESKESLVPIDRDPVPQRFSDLVRRYNEKLGSAE